MQIPMVGNVYNVHLLVVFGISWVVESDIHKNSIQTLLPSHPIFKLIYFLANI